MKKTKTKSKKKLFRVDVRLSYLYLTERENYGSKIDIVKWLNDCHTGELDATNLDDILDEDSQKYKVFEVTDKQQIEDFDLGYSPYQDDNDDLEETCLETLIPELNLDSAEMIRILKSRGYKVEAPK